MLRVIRVHEHVKQRPRFCQLSLLTRTTMTIGTMCITSMLLERSYRELRGTRKQRKRERKKVERKRAWKKGEWVLTESNGLFLYSLALQGWFIDKIMVP